MRKKISLTLAILAVVGQVLFTHRMVKLPNEPFWTSPVEMYDNFAFALTLALSLPAPRYTTLLVMVLIGWIAYRVWYWLLGRFIPAFGSKVRGRETISYLE